MRHKKIIIISIIIFVVSLSSLFIYNYLTSEDKNTTLTLIEKQWIQNNKNKVIDISIINDLPVLNYHGEGIFFDFLNDLEKDTGLVFNRVSYNIGEQPKSTYAFKKSDGNNDSEILIYQDNYVILSRNKDKYNSLTEIKDLNVGVLSADLEKVTKYLLGTTNMTYKSYETSNNMFIDYFAEELEENETKLDVIVLPKTLYLEKIIANDDLNIVYNITECIDNYVLKLGEEEKLNEILKKYYQKWQSTYYQKAYNSHLSNNYFSFKGIDEKDKVKFRSKRYVYGLIENKPYDTLIDTKLSGITNSIITEFAKLSNTEISYNEYSNIESLLRDFNENKIDFFFNNAKETKYEMDIYNTVSLFKETIVIASPFDNNVLINSLNSITGIEISTINNSKVAEYLGKFNIKLKLYNTVDELINSKDSFLALDKTSYEYYVRNKLEYYKIDFETNLDSNYTYTVRDIKDNQIFADYFSFYLSFIQEKAYINAGYNSIINVNMTPIILKRIAIISVSAITLGIIVLLGIRFSPKNRKKKGSNLSKEDKLRYIDMLTSLKNRNYLNDNIELWDESDFYPQTIIIVDLNDVAYINDNYGHAEGDNVIRDAANILIKNQMPNSEIIRTNGNEFLIYLVSYDEKQVVSYMRKLNKELKELPHGFGAAIGYSMINDAIKTIDDAVNEATLDMRNNKEENK